MGCSCCSGSGETAAKPVELVQEKLGILQDEITFESIEEASEIDDAPDEDQEKKLIRKSQTYQLINSAVHELDAPRRAESTWSRATDLVEQATRIQDTIEKDILMRRSQLSEASVHNADTEATDPDERTPEEEAMILVKTEEMIKEVTNLIDHEYDLLPAETILAKVESLLGQEQFVKQVQSTDLFERFARKLDYFYDAGVSCCAPCDGWLEVYSNNGGKEKILGQIDPADPRSLNYKVVCEIPTSLINMMSVANEFELMKEWNQLVVAQPEIIGRRTGHYAVLSYQVSALGGLYKADILNEIRRFSDQEAGFICEYITSVPKDHPSYKDPPSGYKRMQTVLKNLIVACGPNHCVLTQVGKLKMPFALSKWQAKTVGQLAGKFVIGGLIKNSLRAGAPGNVWAAAVQEDKYGFYERLRQCSGSKQSLKRRPKNDGLPAFRIEEIQDLFKRRRFHRCSSRGGVNVPNFP